MSAPLAPLAPLESDDERPADFDAAPADEQAAEQAADLDAPRVEALELASFSPTNPPTGDPTMNEEEKQALALEAAQLEKSIAEATAAGQTLRAEKLTERRARVIARQGGA